MQAELPLGAAIPAMRSRPHPVTVIMPDGRPYTIKKLLSAANHKQEKGVGYRSVGLTLTQRATGHAGRNLCPFATPGCARSCFADFDRLAWPQVKRAAVARTLLLARCRFRSAKAPLFRSSGDHLSGCGVIRLTAVRDRARSLFVQAWAPCVGCARNDRRAELHGASTALHGGAARRVPGWPRRGSPQSLKRRDQVDSRKICIQDICRYVA